VVANPPSGGNDDRPSIDTTRRSARRRCRRPALAAGLAGRASAATATATAQSVAANWAADVVSRRSGGGISCVSGSWVQPVAHTSASGAYSAFWVGLGGSTSSSSSLEQVRTESDWGRRG